MERNGREFTEAFYRRMWSALGGEEKWGERLTLSGDAVLRAPFGVTHLGTAAFASAGTAIGELVATAGVEPPSVRVDSVLASAWLVSWALPVGGWDRGTPWHGISTDYETADGRWLRLQANYPHLRQAIIDVLKVEPERGEIANAIKQQPADEVEQAIIDGGGTAAASRTLQEWAEHPQGRAVAAEPLVDIELRETVADTWRPTPERPLAGIRVLDCTRVLAGPMGTRLLGGYGAEVLRIDPPGYTEPGGSSGGDLTLGKRCAFIDLRADSGRETFLELLSGADVLIHGYRPGALDGLGLGPDVRRTARPGLVEVTLDAYGWTGPWRGRRGFDTLVQTSIGATHEMMRWTKAERPSLLPAQVLDHGTGYLMAAAVIRGLTERVKTGRGSVTRLALARTAYLLVSAGAPPEQPPLTLPVEGPLEDRVYTFPRGPVRRLKFPLEIDGAPLFWERPGDPYGTATPTWATFPTAGRPSS